MTHDCLRGYGSLHDFTRLGTRILVFGSGDIMIIMLNLHRSDIRSKFKQIVSMRSQIAKHVFFALNTFVPAKGYK
jgi:hypothetical protein